MNNFLELASSRRSIRKFQEKDVPDAEITYLIRAAVSAPSGCNSQNWRFVAVKDKEVIRKMAEAVIAKLILLLAHKWGGLTEDYRLAKRKMATFFTGAPVVIAVFMTQAQYYDEVFVAAMKEKGVNEEGFMKLLAHYDLLSVGAAVQNLLLAAHERGLGACWMNEPAIAGETINKILGVPLSHKFVSLIPVGYPAYTPREKKMKDLKEVFSVI